MAPLSDAQVAAFERDGYLLLRGIIPFDVAKKAEAAIWEGVGADPNDPATWEGKPWGSGHTHPDALAAFTPELAAAVDQLSGETRPDVVFPRSAFAINIFPQTGEWSHHGPHIDHALEKDGFHVFPRPMRLASLLYLTDCKQNGGATVVWPGSHKKILALAESDRTRFTLMTTLNRALTELDLGAGIQVEGRQGDVLLYHYLCAHSGSNNVRDYPRFAFAHKW
jgi:ectoine hydroxylase-related dioxygenase (phytanoyl-CoA dioxygenase family)